MHNSHQRSSSKKTNRQSRDSPEVKERYSQSHNQLLATKFGELTQRGLQATNSRQLEKKKAKNQGDNTEYIRNLYKKYLGKENSNNSQRKIKTDMKDTKTQKTLITQSCKQKLNYEGENYTNKSNVLAESGAFKQKKNHFTKKSPSVEKEEKISISFYEEIRDLQSLDMIGNGQNSLVRAMKIINSIRKNYR